MTIETVEQIEAEMAIAPGAETLMALWRRLLELRALAPALAGSPPKKDPAA